jgi:hypothetical protein
MARATNHSTTRLSNLFRDPFLRAAFKAAEDDGTSPELIEVYTGRDKDGALVRAPSVRARSTTAPSHFPSSRRPEGGTHEEPIPKPLTARKARLSPVSGGSPSRALRFPQQPRWQPLAPIQSSG